MRPVSPLARWVAGILLALAIVGPVAGAAALMVGELPLWRAPVAGMPPPAADAGVWLGTWPTLACIGLMLAAPLRLAAAIGLHRRRWWGRAAVPIAALVGCLDLSVGPVMAIVIGILWGRVGPDRLFRKSEAAP